MLLDHAGKYADEMFEDIGHSGDAKEKLKTLIVGELTVRAACHGDSVRPARLWVSCVSCYASNPSTTHKLNPCIPPQTKT